MLFKHRFFYIKPPKMNEYENDKLFISAFHDVCYKL